jgi:CheY-like chemotaxis protein/CHASE3 domain sensor protein
MPNSAVKSAVTASALVRGPLRRSYSLHIVFAAVLLFMLANGVMLLRAFETVREEQRWVTHTHLTLSQLDRLTSAVKDAETAHRGFLLSGDDAYLAPYESARGDIADALAQLRTLMADNRLQLERVASLTAAVDEKLEFIKESLGQFHADGRTSDAAKAQVRAPGFRRGLDLMVQVRSIAAAMMAEEEQLLAQRTQAARDANQTVDRSFAFLMIVDLLLVVVTFLLVRRYVLRQEEERWLKEAQARLASAVAGETAIEALSNKVLDFLAEYLGASVGRLYVQRGESLESTASYAGAAKEAAFTRAATVRLGEGVVGEAARLQRVVTLEDVPSDYLKISSGLGEATPRHVLVAPTVFESATVAVLELGSLRPFPKRTLALLEELSEPLAASIAAAMSRARLQQLLEETQAQSEELQSQQEELRVINEELQTQTQALKFSQDHLQNQQEELRQTNEELEQQARALEAQQSLLKQKNDALEATGQALADKAKELEATGKYKSEFLANMSHELRTPLNSMLILSTLLSENAKGNLDEEQISFARTINGAGNDLLALINDVLDLSKVEAGKLDITLETVRLSALAQTMEQTFRPVAATRKLSFATEIAPDLPKAFTTDEQRVSQVLKNLLSNAFKVTETGGVTLRIGRPGAEQKPMREELAGVPLVAFSVVDTGIGIQEEKHRQIFEAFQQVDSAVNRKYGGTGLGLTISRELAYLLGGEVWLASTPGQGSTFTLVLPETPTAETAAAATPPDRPAAPRIPAAPAPPPSSLPRVALDDDRAAIAPGDRSVLLVEDDPVFAKILLDTARSFGFKGIVATSGDAALEVLRERMPRAVVLDLKLPGISGFGLLEALKSDPKTRHLPVHIVSGLDEAQSALKMGAIGYLVKPVDKDGLTGAFQRIESLLDRKVRRVLVVEDDALQRESVCRLIQGDDVETTAVGLAGEALDLLRNGTFDCMILDLRLPDLSGFDLLETMGHDESVSRPPVVVYTGKDLTREEVTRLRRYSASIILKGARSPERLIDEVSLFLHRVESELPEPQRRMLQDLRREEKPFAGRVVLIVDDDLRNTFALLSALEPKGLKAHVARNGREALEALDRETIELVLMDIMMPEMDGYQAMREIRKQARFRNLPIIALTAKAMKDDQEKCLEAGANDYLAKPIDLDRLISVLRAWLPSKDKI